MKCADNCHCGKHDRHDRIPPPNNTPSDRFDWDAAIVRMRKIFEEVYEHER